MGMLDAILLSVGDVPDEGPGRGRRRFKLSVVLLWVFGALSAIVAVLDMLDALKDTWLAGYVPHMTLLLLAALAVYLLEERREELGELRRAMAEHDETLIESLRVELRSANDVQTSGLAGLLDLKGSELVAALEGVEVRPPIDQLGYYRYLADRVSAARDSIDDLTWGAVSAPTRSSKEEDAYKQYVTAMKDACEKSHVRIREVFTFPSERRIERARELLANALLKTYYVRYFDVDHEDLPPLMQFTLIDRKEVVFGTHRGELRAAEGERYLAVMHPGIVALFADYFDTIWEAGLTLRDSQTSDPGALDRLQAKLERLRATLNRRRRRRTPPPPNTAEA